MANPEHVAVFRRGVAEWNAWRQLNQGIQPDLSAVDLVTEGVVDDWNKSVAHHPEERANLKKTSFSEATASGIVLKGADLWNADLFHANFSDSDLRNADLRGAILWEASLPRVKLTHADLTRADLWDADLRKSDLREADLRGAQLVRTKLQGTNVSGASVFGASVWGVGIDEDTDQFDLAITAKNEPVILRVDDLQVAQFVFLLLDNKAIRNVINVMGKKGVLILGRFTPDRKLVLDAIRNRLRELGYVPMMFDFDKPKSKDFTETIMTLAGMSRFIIADITNPRSSPLELAFAVPNYMIPFVPIIEEGQQPFAMFKDLYLKYDWVLPPLSYDSAEHLVSKLEKAVINRALERHKDLMFRKAQDLPILNLDDV